MLYLLLYSDGDVCYDCDDARAAAAVTVQLTTSQCAPRVFFRLPHCVCKKERFFRVDYEGRWGNNKREKQQQTGPPFDR